MIDFDKKLIEIFNMRADRYSQFEHSLQHSEDLLIYESSPESYASSCER